MIIKDITINKDATIIKDISTVNDIAANRLAVSARESLSDYCHHECKAYCCRKGYLLLTKKEVKLMPDTNEEDLRITPIQTKINEKKYVFNLGYGANGCPNLLDYRCNIHKNPNRPKACKEFPLFIWKNKRIMVTYACPAVKENKLYPYLAKFKRMGYDLIYIAGKY